MKVNPIKSCEGERQRDGGRERERERERESLAQDIGSVSKKVAVSDAGKHHQDGQCQTGTTGTNVTNVTKDLHSTEISGHNGGTTSSSVPAQRTYNLVPWNLT